MELILKRTLMLVPLGMNIGLTTISIGLVQKICKNNFDVKFFKPIFYNMDKNHNIDHTTKILKQMSSVSCFNPIQISNINNFLVEDKKQNIIDIILSEISNNIKHSDVLFLEGLCLRSSFLLSNEINYEIAQLTNAEVIFVCTIRKNNIFDITNTVEIIKKSFIHKKNINIKGIIINEFKIEKFDVFGCFVNFFDIFNIREKDKDEKVMSKQLLYEYYNIPILGYIPWNSKLLEPTLEELSLYFRAHVINQCYLNVLCIKSIILYKRNIFCKYKNGFFYRSMLIVSSDYIYDLKVICEYINENNSIIAILLTDSNEFLMNFVKSWNFFKILKIPILLVESNVLQTIVLLQKFNFKLSIKNSIKFKMIQDYVSEHISNSFITSLKTTYTKKHQCQVRPSMFIYNLLNLAKKNKAKILLPEGNESRIIEAATICSNKNIADCVLLGNLEEIKHIAKLYNIKLSPNIEVLNPELIRNNYIERFVQLRNKHSITTAHAQQILKDDTVLSTLILESNKVDGLVSGAINTTSNTILPALQLIKTSKLDSLISSVFFMLLPDHVLLYSDCAINPDPNSDQLAEIAIQSADTAISFGIFPKIAMLSYATGSSGSGEKVDKVRKATSIVRSKCPHLIVEGPIQYDAAIESIVSKLKCPKSIINGSATIFIFPDLNSGNITYKAVQRSTNTIAIGPILQGIKKPVNDLSRGSSVQDIVYTIAITAVQSKKFNKII
ncbi:phosphate acetyltransferase [Buchnera aphidicola (Melaphis rhois)]|uniref:Phosphate acetyltransferase n=1 Tax=Buchnera aphidicola subsp. Melaphis rhois TaxID=118103 RepID=A0A4D6Y3K3_BUCMH|nr:phosphate acetyltransferase [Buchnera aphidicola (Melaphis rhois)]